MKLKTFLVAAMAAMVCLSGYAQQTPEDAGVYYLYNTETGKFLTRGNTWGTQAVTNDFGSPWQVRIADGKYTLRMYDLVVDGSTSGLGSNGYADNGSPIAFTPSGDANGYKLQNGDNYLCSPDTYGNSVLYNDANYNTTWQFLNVTEYKAVLAAKTSAQESAIATTAGVDLGGSTLGAIVEDANNWRFSDVSSAVPFPSNSSWTHTGVANRGGNQNEGTYGVECYQGGVTYSYTATGLAKGIYKVGIKAMFRSVNNAVCSTVGDAGFVNSSAYLSANGNLVQVKDWYSSRASASDPNSTDAFVTIANNGGYLSEVYTYVGDDGKLELKAVSESYWGGSWFLFNGITLTYYNNSVSEEDATALLATVPTAKMSDATQATLDAAVSAFEANKTIANYNTLNAAITAANISVAEYATIASGVIPTDGLTGWSKTTTAPTFHINTWSTEGNSDGSGMTTPFVENWIASGGQLGAGRVQYTFTDLNPGESYVITARVRVFNEAATGVTGATYFVGESTKTLEQFGSACIGDYATKGKFAVLSCAGTVDANGDLQFGVELAEGSPINWIAIKDVTIAEGTGDIPTAIELNKTSVSLTTGSADALVATITPATADDKTIIWSTSDASVVSVSGGNIVALKAGTATITANAFAGDNVNATCTVTVADAAAPAFYSETIAAGDYYIMNAATGTFLGGGNSWGTQASVVEHGIPFGVAVGEGVYTLDSYTYNNADSHFLNGTYVDGASTNLYITSLGNGKFSISTADGSAFETVLAGSTVVSNTAANADSPLAQWYFLSKNDRDKMLQSATAENPVDATYYIKQANISRNRSAGAYNVNAWNPYSNAGGNNDNFNFYKANAAVNVWQTIEGIPNGTYTLKMQGCTTGSAVLWANEASVDILANNGDITDQATASTAFSAGKYVNTVDVTVTNRTLSITVKSDDTDKVTTFDNFELYLKSYEPVTAIAAELDKTVIQIGQTAQITTTSTPAAASFNAPTSYSSSDESIATVDANGVVTGVAVGTATITVHADEMESNSTTVDITVTFIPATPEDYAALNAAIEAAEAKTLGFDEDEYAPYNNTAALALLAAAKAIDQDADNTQEDVQAATTALTGVEWNQNATEVNAVYDGTFAAATNNGAPAGWRMSNNTLGGDYHSRAFVGDERLAEFNETNSGLFIRFDGTNSSRGSMYYYGDTENYTMPLKAGVTYYVKVDFAGWGSTGKPLRMNITGPTGFDAKNQQYNTSVRADNADNTPQQFLVVFTATVDGNYVINFQTPGADSNTHNVVISNVELKRATAATMKITDAQYATFVAPFAVTIPDGVTATTVESVSGNTLVMENVTTTIPANTPVVLFKEGTLDATTFYGYPIEGTPTAGLLTGVYTETAAPKDSYVLQNLNGKVGFYQVEEGNILNVPANRAYLTVPTVGVKAFFFDKETGINGVLNEIAAGNIYDLSGRKVAKMQKGQTYIIDGKKVNVK